MIRPTFSWDDYFSGTSIETTLSGEHKTRQNPSASSVYVLNCLFNGCTSGSNGGALYCTSVTSLLIESSSFFSCKTSSSHYGAIQFTNSNGQCVLYCVCGYDCCSTREDISYCQFTYVQVNNGASSKNYVNYSSISRCVNGRSDSNFILFLNNGKIYCPSVNMSMNKCQYYSAIYCNPFLDSSSVTHSLSYSSFVDNNAFGYNCLYFGRGDAKYEIKCCNILRNTQGTNTWGMIYSPGNLFIDDSCILENTAACIFYLTSSSYSTTLSNCTVDKTTTNQNLITRDTVTKSFILGLNHMSTQNCNSEYDSVGTLSVIPYVPSPTKKLSCYTCKRNDILSRISDFFSLNWVFIVPFININPSVDY
jgi:hypothetical protein